MNSWMDSTTLTAIGMAIVHSLWQGTLVAIATCLIKNRFSTPGDRCWVAAFGLMACIACPILTCLSLAVRASENGIAWIPGIPSIIGEPLVHRWVAAAWLLGVATFSLRPILGFEVTKRWMGQPSLPLPPQLATAMEAATERIGVRRGVAIRVIREEIGPMVVGCLRPVILLPLSVASSLSTAELEVLLAHELAHVRRGDGWINALQAVAETVLFYHPAVWWLSGQIRIAREQCCDDMAAPNADRRLCLGRVLLALENQRSTRDAAALSVRDGDLIDRIRRLSQRPVTHQFHPAFRLAACIPMVVIACASASFIVSDSAFEGTDVPLAPISQVATQTPTDSVHGSTEEKHATRKTDEELSPWDVTLHDCLRMALLHRNLLLESDELQDPAQTVPAESSVKASHREPTELSLLDKRADRILRAIAEQSLLPPNVLITPQLPKHLTTPTKPIVVKVSDPKEPFVEIEQRIGDLVRDVQQAYWDLQQSYRIVLATLQAIDSAKRAMDVANNSLSNGTGTQQELHQATGQYYLFRTTLLSELRGTNLPSSRRRGLAACEVKLRTLIGAQDATDRLLRPVDHPPELSAQPDWGMAIQKAITWNPDIRQIDLTLSQLDEELSTRVCKGKPEPEDYSAPGRWVQLSSGRQLTPPRSIASSRQRLKDASAKTRLRQARAFANEQKRALVYELSDAFAESDAHKKLVQTNAQQWEASEAEVQARLAEFRVGRSPVNVVLQSQQRRHQAQQSYFHAINNYQKASAHVSYLKGTLLEDFGVMLASVR
ncbi:MAG: M56 family metallopeptidase [Planctomycetota bacterium]